MSVSSEAKRTLVESPPELWAELSDAESLSRHLGELGEIRIVRVDPERSVEWEAEEVSGTVTIEPSGWGTKVTLTAVRPQSSAPPRDATRAADADAEASLEAAAESLTELEPELLTEAEPEPVTEFAREPVAELQSAVEPQGTANLKGAAEPEPRDEIEVAEQPAPAVEAEADTDTIAEAEVDEPEIEIEPESAHEPEPELTHELEPVHDPELAHNRELAQEGKPALEAEPASEPQPRRGFFSRLFGRRRRESQPSEERAPSSPGLTFQAPLTAISMGEIGPQAGTRQAPPAETPDFEAFETVAEDHPYAAEPIETEEAEEAEEADALDLVVVQKPPFDWEPIIAPEGARETGAGGQSEAIETRSAIEPPEAIETHSAIEPPIAIEPPCGQASRPKEASPLAEASPREEATRAEELHEPQHQGDGQPEDLSAELASLEERTTAVLVGVLDRLGAAHHRPFSRG